MIPDDGSLTWLLHDLVSKKRLSVEDAIKISKRATDDTQKRLRVTDAKVVAR